MRILLTAYEPYDDWPENSSWLTLKEMLLESPSDIELTTRRYPVDLAELRKRLVKDLEHPYDGILHLGQSPGAAALKLEAVALNIAGIVEESGQPLPKLVPEGPLAYESGMPLGRWAEMLRRAEIPVTVSYHAGAFLCNAIMYLSHYYLRNVSSKPRIGFVHLPLATEQVTNQSRPLPSLTKNTMAKAIRMLLKDFVGQSSLDSEESHLRV